MKGMTAGGINLSGMRRPLVLSALSALALAGAACAVSAPEREPLPVPTEVTPDYINPTDPEALFAGRGECLLAVGAGVKVLQTLPDTAAERVLRAGDVVTSVNGVPVGSLESLLAVTADLRVGDVAEVEGARDGERFTAGVALGPAPENPSRPIVGFIPETKIAAASPAGVRPVGDSAGGRAGEGYSRPVNLGGRLLRFNPLDSSWSQYPGIPTSRMAGLGTELYTLAASDHPRALVRMGEHEVIAFEQPPDLPGLAPNSGAIVFEAVLGSVGNLLLVSAWTEQAPADDSQSADGPPGEAGRTYLIVGADPAEAKIVWIRPLPISPQGYPWAAETGFRSPSGEMVLVGIVEVDPVFGVRAAVLTYLVLDETGGPIPRPGLADLASAGVVTGWYDDNSLLYMEPASAPRVATWTFDSGEHELLLTVGEEEARGLRLVTPVGDGRHLLQINESGVTLLDGERRTVVRPVARGCSYAPIGGLAG